jgi:putative ABC transport system permease protein
MREQDWCRYVETRLPLEGIRPERQAEIVLDLAQQLDLVYRDARERGATPAEALQAAEAQVADWPALGAEIRREEAARVRPALDAVPSERAPFRFLSDMPREAVHALRTLLSQRTLSLTVVLTLGLAIGANTAVFSVFHAALLRPLPYQEPERLVTIAETVPRQQFPEREASWPNFADWKERQRTLSDLAGYSGAGFTVLFPEGAERISASVVTWNFFRVLGVRPALGRDFEPADEPAQAPGVVLLTHGYWTRRFAADPGVVGRRLVLDGVPFTVIGVLPPGFHLPSRGSSEAWAPLRMDARRLSVRTFHWLFPIGRLRPGVTLEAAQADMSRVAAALSQQHAQDGAGVRLRRLTDEMLGPVRPTLLALMAAVLLVLLLACVNVANLLLAKAAARERQTAIRVALGASRASLLRQVLLESAMLAAAGGALGVLLARAGVLALIGSLPPLIRNVAPSLSATSVSLPALAFAAALTLVTGLAFGLLPAWHAGGTLPQDVLRHAGRGVAGRSRSRLRRALIVSEVALALVLLVGAGLMLRSLEALLAQPVGFRAENLQTFHLLLPQSRYREPHQVIRFVEELRVRLRSLPGVAGVATTNNLPLSNDFNTATLTIDGRPAPAGEEPEAAIRTASPGYFEVMGIPVSAGRGFVADDTAEALPVAVVNETFVRRFLEGPDPLGRRVTFRSTNTAATVVGVVGDVKLGKLDGEIRPTIYVCDLQVPVNAAKIAMRVTGDRGALLAAAAREVRALDPELPLFLVRTMEEIVAESPSVFSRRSLSILLVAMAAPALLLAALGLYGVMSWSAARRTQEMGVRIAVGARPADIFRLVIGEGMLLVALGAGVGAAAALPLARLLGSLLFGIGAADPPTFGAVACLLAATALLACSLPAWRATRVDPLVALRHD